MQINVANTSFTQTGKPKKNFSNGVLIAAGSAFTAVLAAPLIYGNGLQEYQNRNKSKLAAAALSIGLLSGAAKFLIDKSTDKKSDEKRKMYLNSVLALAIIPISIMGDYQAAIAQSLLKEKNQKFCKTIVNSIKKIFDIF